jgi:hypothetical protein
MRYQEIITEAKIDRDRWKFWYNVNTNEVIWLGGADHHAHSIYYAPYKFGLTAEQVAYLSDHPAMQDVDDDDDDEDDLGGRIIYLPELFWQVMQHGWVRGGLEGDYDMDDSNSMHPYGLYLEGKSLPDIAHAAQHIASIVEGDAEFPDEDEDWIVENLRFAVRSDATRSLEQSYRLSGKRARYFMTTGRLPSTMMRD